MLVAIAIVLGVSAGEARAALTADVRLAADSGTLWCHARVKGIEPGQAFQVTFRWTAPSARFVNSLYTPTKKLGDDTSKARCYCADTGEKGCQRTKAYRTVEYVNTDGKRVKARGLWKCEVLVGDVVIGSAEYTVE